MKVVVFYALIAVVTLECQLTTAINSTTSADKHPLLIKCPHVNPYHDLEKWSKVDANASNCDPLTRVRSAEIEDEDEKRQYVWGSEKFAYDVLVSDKIGPRRHLPLMANELCKQKSYAHLFQQASIVIIYHNEALSVLIRMINSIFSRTPEHLLKEIIVYDDCSDSGDTIIEEKLISYGKLTDWPMSKIITKRSDERLGLIKAKVFASRLATGDILIFLDSHCEGTKLWIEPLLAPIQEDPTRVVLPVVDIINPITFEYTKAMIAKGSFDWSLKFEWKYFPWEYFDEPKNNVETFRSAVMSGGLLAVNKEFFREMGEYDTEMKIWGAENIEMSIRIWLCGGSVLIAPCSRVGHVFRVRRPYKSNTGIDNTLYNAVRTVKVWFENYDKYFYQKQPRAEKIDVGDLSERLEIKRRLNCKPFEWFIQNLHPDLIPKETVHEEF